MAGIRAQTRLPAGYRIRSVRISLSRAHYRAVAAGWGVRRWLPPLLPLRQAGRWC